MRTDDGRSCPPRTVLLSCASLTVRHDAQSRTHDTIFPAVNDVTLAVHSGEVVGLVGRNGAGKSTLIRTAAGLLPAERGMIRVVGQNPRESPTDVMRSAGFLLSEPALFAYLTASETLAVVAELHGFRGDAATRRIQETLALVELDHAVNQRAGEFSTGMAKRLALACALLPDPALLVLDEPFESLDPLVVRRLVRALRARRDGGVGVLLSSHLLATVTGLCDRVAIMDRGRILADGSVPELIAAHAPDDDRSLEGAYAALMQTG